MPASGQARRGEALQTPPGSKDSNGTREPSGAAASLPGHFLFIIPSMPSSNWIKIIAAAAVGVALGLLYGWVIDPVEYTDITPASLREDYRADYVLTVAEAYHSEFNSGAAARRLALLGSEPPDQYVIFALEYARTNNFTDQEISLLQDLLSAMQSYQPAGGNTP